MNCSSNPHSARLITVAHQLIEQLPDRGLQAAGLVGSAAWGDADAASDLDIMLLLNLPIGYREVTRIHLADFFEHPLPDGPLFADLDRISAESFIDLIHAGALVTRVVNSIILKDTDGCYARLRDQVSKAFLHPAAREKRFLAREQQAEESRQASLMALGTDALLSALHARLALQHAGAALIELSGNRVSPSHFIENLEQVLRPIDHNLFIRFLSAQSLDAPHEAVERSLRAYDVFTDTLKKWLEDTTLVSQLSPEELAWARHTYNKQEEITYKVAAFTQTKRLPSLLYYLDGLFQVPIRMQISNIFLRRSGSLVKHMPIAEFHIALHQEPALYDEWIAALRLSAERDKMHEIADLTNQLLAIGRAMLIANPAHQTGEASGIA